MKTLFALLLMSLLAVGCAGVFPSKSQRPDEMSFKTLELHLPTVAKKQLDNGVRVYLRENQELPLVELTVMVEGGSLYDPAEKTGLSQFFAEVLRSGGSASLTAEELEQELEDRAIGFSVSSSSYCYEINLSVHRDDLERGLEILADLMEHPRFDGARLELAREQMLEELHRKDDEPGSIARRLLAQAVNPGHPFGRFPTEEEINGFERADLVALHQRFFNPHNTWMAVSGDVSMDEFLTLAGAKFGAWSTAPGFVRDFPSLPNPPRGKILLADKNVPQTTILMGHQGISKDNPDTMALKVANYILGGGGFNSRLMREVRSNRGLAYSVYSYFQIGRHLPGMFIAGSETKSESTVEVVGLMKTLMTQLITEPVSEEELDLARKSLINSFVFAFEDSHSVVSRRMRLDYYGYPKDYMETYRQQIADVSVADVERVARQYLHPDLLQVVLVGDSSQYSGQLDEVGLPVAEVDLNKAL